MPPPSREFPVTVPRRVSLKLTFAFHHDSNLDFDELYCRLAVDDQPIIFYGSGVYLLCSLWNDPRQEAMGPTREARQVNQYLSDIRADHWLILQNLLRSGNGPTAQLIRHHWCSGETLSIQLLPLYEEFLTKLHQAPLPERMAQPTLYKWNRGYHLLLEYLDLKQGRAVSINQISIGWAKTYYQWLRKRPLSIDSASRYIGQLRELLQYAVERELLPHNKLKEWQITAQPARVVQCLSLIQLRQMEDLTLPLQLDCVRKWALLSCYTGLDFKDAVELVASPASHLVHLSVGEKIVIRRQKFKAVHQALPEWGVSHIPLLPEAKQLLTQAHEWPPVTIQRVNRNLEVIEKQLGLPFRLTTKICRKTAGALFLLRGYRTEAVQKILGIRHLRTLERNYLHLYSELVDENMQRVESKNRTDSATFTPNNS